MLRTHTCGQLRLSDVNKSVTLTGWVQRSRDKGSVLWVDLRDRYGITQLILEEAKTEAEVLLIGRGLGPRICDSGGRPCGRKAFQK